MIISIIAAIGKNRELGRDNKLLWHIPEDMKRFRTLTKGQTVIMGRKTYESLPSKFRPLPDRINIVISRDGNYHNKGIEVCTSIDAAIKKAKEYGRGIFIIGGAQIYALAIEYADKLFLTQVDRSYPDADAFFPDFSRFKTVISQESNISGNLQFKFIELVK